MYLEDYKYTPNNNTYSYLHSLAKVLSNLSSTILISRIVGGVNELIDRIKKQKLLGNLYKAIFIETYRPNEYNTNKYLKDNKVTLM